MYRPNNKTVAYSILLIIVASAFYTIGVNSNGSNPTIDEVLGIFDFLWGNFTQGVNSPDYYRYGQNYTEWIESISGADGNPFDQDLNTTDSVTFSYVNATYEFYRNGLNYTEWIESLSGGTSDHGLLTGLDDDDHPQYLLDSEDTGNFTTVEKGGVEVGTEERLNFIEGDNVTLTIVDDPTNDEIDITITSTGGSGTSEGQEQPYDYLVYTNSTHIFALYGDNETLAYISSDAHAVMQYCVDALYNTGGIIFVKEGIYDFGSNSLVIDGGGRSSTTGKRIEIGGSGQTVTELTADSGVSPIILANASRVYLHDFKGEAYNADVIFGDGTNDGAYPFDSSTRNSVLERLWLKVSGGSSSGWGMRLQNSDMNTYNEMYIQSWGSGAVLLEALADATYSYGNSVFGGFTILHGYGNSEAVFKAIGYGSRMIEDVVFDGESHFFGAQGGGVVCVFLNRTRSILIPSLKSEGCETIVKIIGESYDNIIGMPHYNIIDDDGYYVDLGSNAVGNIIENVFVRYASAGKTWTIIRDNQTDPREANTFRNFLIYGPQDGTLLFEISPASILEGWVSYDKEYQMSNKTISTPFIYGSEIRGSSGDTPLGMRVDATGEYAMALLTLPYDLHRVLAIKIFATAEVANTSGMRVMIRIRGCQINQTFDQEKILINSHDMDWAGFGEDYLITWTLTSSDDSDIGDLLPLESLQVHVIWTTDVGDDMDTRAIFRDVQVIYN